MGMLVYSCISPRKIVHLPHCPMIQQIAKQNRRQFDSLDQAHQNGFRLCKCCPSAARKFNKERRGIKAFCNRTGMTVFLAEGEIHIVSEKDTWRIIAPNGKHKKLVLYHRSAIRRKGETNLGPVPGFHIQAFRSPTILGYLQYIEEHDNYRRDNPMISIKDFQTWETKKGKKKDGNYTRIKGTKKYRDAQNALKNREHWMKVNRVYAIIDEIRAAGR